MAIPRPARRFPSASSAVRSAAVGASVLALLAGAASVPGCARRAESPRRSVLLVSLDTVRADHLGIYGSPRGTSPHFDRFARRGGLFLECMAQATATLPSHRSLFRSAAASRSTADAPMLAEILQEAGFATCAFTGGGNLAGSLGFSAGFDRWEEDRGGLAWANPAFAAWLDAEPRRPFFAFLHTYDAHMPYDPPRALAEAFDPGYTGIVTGPTTRPLARAIRGLDEMPGGPPALSEADRRHFVALYDGAIRHADDLLGDLLRTLESRGLRDSTTIVVFSDHGEEFWEHGSVLHSHTVHRELAHVPLAVAGAALVPGSLHDGVVRLLDVAPTILDLASVPEAPSHAGESLAPQLRAPRTARVDRPAIVEMARDKALLEYPWKLIVEDDGARRSLYDTANDPGETRDLLAARAAGRPGAAADSIAAALWEKLAAQVTGGAVEELSQGTMSPEQRERLKALGYVN